MLSILLDEDKINNSDAVSYARKLLCWFSENCVEVYGDLFAVYNVHALRHLADDVVHHKCSLNQLSAFRFENYMQQLKKMVRISNSPIAQIVKRSSINENNLNHLFKCKLEFKDNGRDIFFQCKSGN